jgi:hypothetical protein
VTATWGPRACGVPAAGRAGVLVAGVSARWGPVGKLRPDRGSMEVVTRSRAIVSAAIAVALLFVVAAAAGVAAGGRAIPAAGAAESGVTGGLGGPTWAGSLVVALVSAGGVWVMYSLLPGLFRRRPRGRYLKRPWWYWPAVVAATLAVSTAFFTALSWLLRGKLHPLAPNGGAHPPLLGGFPRLSGASPVSGGGGGSGVSWIAIAAGALVALLAIIALHLLRRRRLARGPVQSGLPRRGLDEQRRREVVEVLDESLEALEAEPDPRKAVIAAYVRMDRWLARAGFGRRNWEAPFEHLDRIVGDLGATTAVGGTLAGLYERAKFDYRPCGAEMKQAALAALVQLRDELASLPAASGTGATAADSLAAGAGVGAGAAAGSTGSSREPSARSAGGRVSLSSE